MKQLKFLIISVVLLCVIYSFSCGNYQDKIDETKLLSYSIDPKRVELNFYFKDKNKINFSSFKNLKSELQKEKKELIFATNGGMFNKDHSPQGLYIENGIVITELDTIKNGYGNFYLQPNGVFSLTKTEQPNICRTKDFKNDANINYATQSGPMLLINGELHPKFNKGSKNIHIRNGVGILENGNLLFAMSKEKINFYDFASYFKQKGCKNALYLDGFVSKTYLPSKDWSHLDGDFGVIIGVTKTMNN
jgi:uncharacterized protein YigE (DUF2233 family)